VEEGRVIYDNIRKFVRYLLSSNVGEILVMFVALLIGWPIPLLAIQILWVNLVTDGLPAIALGFEPGEGDVMRRPPRAPQESIFAHGMGRSIVFISTVLAVITLVGYYWAYRSHDMDPALPTLRLEMLDEAELARWVGDEHVPEDWEAMSEAERLAAVGAGEGGGFAVEEGGGNELLERAERFPRTVAFTVLALGQIFHVIAIHAGDRRLLVETWFRENPFMLWAVLSTFALQLIVIYVPFFQTTFETVALTAGELVIAIVLASVVLIAAEAEKLFERMRQPARAEIPV
jgi:magnesium-transporting ATPase (P-type)